MGNTIKENLIDKFEFYKENSPSNKKLRIMTWNIANYDDHSNWNQRSINIGELIKQKDIDIIGLQEIRSNILNKKNALKDILSSIKNNYQYIYAPAMMHKIAGLSLKKEGLAFLSRNIIQNFDIFKLKNLDNSIDLNERIVVSIILNLQSENEIIKIQIFNCHLSYDQNNLYYQLSQLKTILMANNKIENQIIFGDFNSPEDIEFVDFFDCALLFNKNKGTLPCYNPVYRLDRIYYKSKNYQMNLDKFEVQENINMNKKTYVFSDHLYLFAEFSF